MILRKTDVRAIMSKKKNPVFGVYQETFFSEKTKAKKMYETNNIVIFYVINYDIELHLIGLLKGSSGILCLVLESNRSIDKMKPGRSPLDQDRMNVYEVCVTTGRR